MSEYEISRCVDKINGRPLEEDAAVFVRRIEPPLRTVYTIICDRRGRAMPWRATTAETHLIRTGPVRLSTDATYLAAWIPAAELPQQGNIAEELGRMGRENRYEFQPEASDLRLSRVQAGRWRSRGGGGLSASDQELVDVLNALQMQSMIAQVLVAPPAVRRQVAAQLIQELQEVNERELGGQFILGQSDVAGQLRDRLLQNPEYQRAGPEARSQMITQWQHQLQVAARPGE